MDREPWDGGPETVFRWTFGTAKVLAVVVILALILLLLPARQVQHRDGPIYECGTNLRQLGYALHYYHEQFGRFPPAYVADSEGNPLLSWRVLLLPDVEQGNLYRAFRFDEPWDSPGNKQATSNTAPWLRCASDSNARRTITNYVAITGPGTVFDGAKQCRLSDITKPLDKTIMAVEIADSDIHWAEPRDLSIDRMNFAINTDRMSISSNHGQKGAHVLFCDGHVEFLSNDTSPEKLRDMCLIRGD